MRERERERLERLERLEASSFPLCETGLETGRDTPSIAAATKAISSRGFGRAGRGTAKERKHLDVTRCAPRLL
eukprot:2850024-Rhodomonas_salina.3